MPLPYTPSAGGIPDQDMLLRLIDAKFETLTAMVGSVGKDVTTLATAVADITKRYDSTLHDHEHRIAAIESAMAQRELQVKEFESLKLKVGEIDTWKVEEETTSRNASRWGAAAWGAGGSIVSALIGWLIISFVYATAPQPTVKPLAHPATTAQPVTTQTHTNEVSTTTQVPDSNKDYEDD